ncbi:hypothetical protein FA15DRAFT_673921 [Coprinopsis marcescibilis]|uniref:DUF6534 domain-containing protein n=1 Tax=Coprinopsis marcescibilis TaxID=230819 RepID=A0A5C3KJB9_COPMA|nr:hypothetical protein FA15DRAFT_673921 [Coprinopsis marcescibilis]
MSLLKTMLALNLGPVLLGVFVNTYLYGIVTLQYATYLTTKFQDPLWIKFTVLMLFLLDTVHSSSLIWMVWVYTVENFGNYAGLLIPIWPYPLTIVVTALTAFVTQFFLSYRIFRLTKGRVMYFITIFIELVTLALGFVCAVKAWSIRLATELAGLRPYLTAWLCLEMAIDVVICGMLLYTLGESRTGFAKSDTVIRRLMRAAIQTGCFAGIFAAITLILFLTKGDTQLFSMFGIPIGRVYSNTLMDTILCRGELRDLVGRREETTQQLGNGSYTIGSHSVTSPVQLHIHKEIHTDIQFERPETYLMQSPKSTSKMVLR